MAADSAMERDTPNETEESTVVSGDGTTIALSRSGSGPAIVIVDGAFGSRSFGPNEKLPPLLADRFTVVAYDRRGRGESGDSDSYSVDREVEDLAAVIDAAGGRACVYGISSGAALALEAARRGLPIEKLVLFEAPFVVDSSRAPIPVDLSQRLRELVAAGKRGAAVRLFMTAGVGLNPAMAAMMRITPGWKPMSGAAHTLPYDTEILDSAATGAGRPLPPLRWRSLPTPTLVLDGSKSPDWMRNAMAELAEVLPAGEHRTLEKQWHFVKPAAVAPVIAEFAAR